MMIKAMKNILSFNINILTIFNVVGRRREIN